MTRLRTLCSPLLPPYTAAGNLTGDIVLTTHKNSCLKDVLDSNSSCKHAVLVFFLFCFHVHSNEFLLACEAFLCYKKQSQSVERPALSPTTLSLSFPVTSSTQEQNPSVFCNNADCPHMFSSRVKSSLFPQLFTQRKSSNIQPPITTQFCKAFGGTACLSDNMQNKSVIYATTIMS